jgi:hypothetical protein
MSTAQPQYNPIQQHQQFQPHQVTPGQAYGTGPLCFNQPLAPFGALSSPYTQQHQPNHGQLLNQQLAPNFYQGTVAAAPTDYNNSQGLSTAALAVQAKKAKTKCVTCGVIGHWRDDGLCSQENVQAKSLQNRYTAEMLQTPRRQGEINAIIAEFNGLQQLYPNVAQLHNPSQYQISKFALPQITGNL